MPNQRHKDKRHLGGFVHKKLYAALKRHAKAGGMRDNVFGFATQLIAGGIAKLEKKKAKANKTKL
jgi:hypothetical protein